jgi:hypothetical protein
MGNILLFDFLRQINRTFCNIFRRFETESVDVGIGCFPPQVQIVL